MPAAVDGAVNDQGLRRWLARGDLEVREQRQEILFGILKATGTPATNDGLAALRLWGQTGDRPTVWIAAADPVHIEAALDHLRLHCLWPDEWQDRELRVLFDELQSTLADVDSPDFVRIGARGYLRGDSPMPTALLSAASINGLEITNELPAGPEAASFHRLLCEIQMTMHNSPVNQQRAEQNKRAINSLWIWGGGTASEPQARDIPPLFADDALIRGYWNSCIAAMEPWPGTLDGCAERAPHGFVAVTPDYVASGEEYADLLSTYLRDLRRILRNSELRQLKILFRNGLTARLSAYQIFRIWRRETAFQSLANKV